MAAKSESSMPRFARLAAFAVVAAVLCWLFPLFHVVPLAQSSAPGVPAAAAAFDPRAAAEKIWKSEITSATSRAVELRQIVTGVRENPETARTKFAKSAGMGVAYFFARGSGRIVKRERNYLHIAVDGSPNEIVALRIGPVFGNTVRDGCGLLDVNSFPGLQEFNAVAAELNALVEKNVLHPLREKSVVGATIQFTGCSEAPEAAADVGEPLLTFVPVQAEIR
jgi:predicted lipoprotein